MSSFAVPSLHPTSLEEVVWALEHRVGVRSSCLASFLIPPGTWMPEVRSRLWELEAEAHEMPAGWSHALDALQFVRLRLAQDPWLPAEGRLLFAGDVVDVWDGHRQTMRIDMKPSPAYQCPPDYANG